MSRQGICFITNPFDRKIAYRSSARAFYYGTVFSLNIASWMRLKNGESETTFTSLKYSDHGEYRRWEGRVDM